MRSGVGTGHCLIDFEGKARAGAPRDLSIPGSIADRIDTSLMVQNHCVPDVAGTRFTVRRRNP